jgi:small subunit ribosomal protein S1
MAYNDLNSVQTESTALNTTLEPTTTDEVTTTETTPTEVSTNPETAQATPQATNHAGEVSPEQPVAIGASHDEHEPEYDADDFAKALESFDREQAAEKDTAQS